MTRFTGLVRLGHDRLVLALPERGMPWIVSMFGVGGEGVEGAEALLSRASRINGMDAPSAPAPFLPAGGMGWFGWPAIAGHRSGRDFIVDPVGWQVERPAGKDSALLSARDDEAGLSIRIELKSLAGGAIQSTVRLTNIGRGDYTLDRCMAGTVLIPEPVATISSFGATWGREFHEHQDAAPSRTFLMESRRGRTSHDRFPALLMTCAGGVLYGVHLGWSGNHVMVVDPTDDGRRLVHAGELFEPGEVILAEGEGYQSPSLTVVRDGTGERSGLTEAFWQVTRGSVLDWPGGAMKPRPVLINTWEGNYFRHDVAHLKAQADAAAALGIERFVLDDGWFGKRDDDTTSLGDWFVDTRKYPDGLKPLVDHVTGLGMEFGLWFEPEMVNRDSDLFRAHPDWALQIAGRPLLESRHQLALDLTRPEVSDFLFERMADVLSRHAISAIKWDMNRDLTHVGDARGRAATGRQTRAVYALMDRLRTAFPALEIESCASGGGRADFGVLQRTHRVWTSDCTDPLERLVIQRGARLFLPPEIMGSHISPSPNHQTHRSHSLAFRAIVAFFGHLGVELNPLTLSEDERRELGAWIALHKTLRPILHHSRGAPIDLEVGDGRHVFGIHQAEDGDERLIIAVAQAAFQTREQPAPLRLPVFSTDKSFTVRRIGPGEALFVRSVASQHALLAGETPISGALLARHGLPVPQLYPQSAILLDIRSIGGRHG